MSVTITSTPITITVQGQQCPCGQAMVGGVCQTLTPAQIIMNPTVEVYPYWMAYNNCGGGSCNGFEGESLNACNFGSGLCNGNPFTFQFSGQVVDSSGHPVCGVKLSYEGGLSDGLTGTIPWDTPDGLAEGYYSVATGTNGETDENGNFTITYTVYMNTTGVKLCTPLNTKENVVGNPVVWTVTVSLPDFPDVQEAQTVVTMDNTICEQNAL